MISMLIYKIFRGSEWAEMQKNGETAGAPIDLADGFIHFSGADTVAKTASLYFADLDDLQLVAVESEALDALKWEESRGDALFPHLFRTLKMTDVVWHKPLPIIGGAHDFGDLSEQLIYKIWTDQEWAALQGQTHTTGSALDRADGFIHFSKSTQVARVLAHFFKDQPNLHLSTIRATDADPALRWEDAGNSEVFPHLYRPLNCAEIVTTQDIPLQNGVHTLPL